MSKHTPGPWEAVDSMTIRGPFEMGNPEKPGMLIATLPAHREDGDARLIAAAPELLDALLDAVESLEHVQRNMPGTIGHGVRVERIASALDAIAKATGEQQ